jgi:Domain of unknown function (DUF5122) beta-propeller
MYRLLRAGLPALLMLVALAAVPAAEATDAAHSVVVSATPVSFTPNIQDGQVNAVAQAGNLMIVGGTFTTVKQKKATTATAVHQIVAFDSQTGVIDTNFLPDIEGGEVSTISVAPGGQAVFVGGEFDTVNGQAVKRLVKLNLADGSIDPTFQGKVSVGSWVEDSQVLGNDLYIGGAFSSIDGVARGRLAAVDVNTGALDPNVNVNFATKRQGTLRVGHFDISPDGTKLVATGTFLTADGLDRAQIAILDLTTTPVSVSSWETNSFKPACSSHFDTYIRDVKWAPDGSYFIVGDTGAFFGGPNSGVLCDSVSRWEGNTSGAGQLPTWADYSGGDSITQVAVTGTAVYAGGHQRWENNPFAGDAAGPGAVGRMGIAALDPVNGMPFSWNPGRDPRGSGVWGLLATPDGLWVGSDTGYIDGLNRNRIALMPVAGGESIPAWHVGALPGDLWTLGVGTNPTHRSFTGTSAGTQTTVSGTGIDFSLVRGAFMIGSTLYTGQSNGQFLSRSFDGTTFGASTVVPLNGLTSSQFPISNLTGMFYDPSTGRLYYTVSGDTHMYYRYFEAEDSMIGAQTFTVSGNGDGLTWNTTSEMTMANGKIYYVVNSLGQQNLWSINFSGGKPVPGTQTLVSGPSKGDGQTWAGRGMFVLPS